MLYIQSRRRLWGTNRHTCHSRESEAPFFMPLPADGAGAAAESLPYPESREITFNNFCEPCDKKAEARITPEERAARQQRSAAVNREIENLKATGPLGALGMGNVVKLGKQAAQEEERLREEERRKQRPESYTRMNWNEMNLALANVHGSGGRPPEMPEYLIIRGTVSRVDVSPPAPHSARTEAPYSTGKCRSFYERYEKNI